MMLGRSLWVLMVSAAMLEWILLCRIGLVMLRVITESVGI